jgi:exo-1,4-beta-D-glucosaminidase
MLHLRATRSKGGTDITPILWDDNYFSLLPGEQREVSASYASSALAGDTAVLEVEGFNIAKQTVEAGTASGGDAN